MRSKLGEGARPPQHPPRGVAEQHAGNEAGTCRAAAPLLPRPRPSARPVPQQEAGGGADRGLYSYKHRNARRTAARARSRTKAHGGAARPSRPGRDGMGRGAPGKRAAPSRPGAGRTSAAAFVLPLRPAPHGHRRGPVPGIPRARLRARGRSREAVLVLQVQARLLEQKGLRGAGGAAAGQRLREVGRTCGRRRKSAVGRRVARSRGCRAGREGDAPPALREPGVRAGPAGRPGWGGAVPQLQRRRAPGVPDRGAPAPNRWAWSRGAGRGEGQRRASWHGLLEGVVALRAGIGPSGKRGHGRSSPRRSQGCCCPTTAMSKKNRRRTSLLLYTNRAGIRTQCCPKQEGGRQTEREGDIREVLSAACDSREENRLQREQWGQGPALHPTALLSARRVPLALPRPGVG